jgi:isoleucyl-tRNA synthetase
MIENRPDWCVSRQRAWGVPIAIFYCEKCETIHIDESVIDHVYNLFYDHGADIWFEKEVDELLPPGTVCKKCGSKAFVRETDILDVWFDSGVSHAAVLEERDYLTWPADLYLEGSDQHRGWFHSSLLTAVGTRNRAPYKAVLTHGFVVDAEGKKMSKSIGNTIAPSKVIKQYGAEILRMWVAASDYRDDIRISDNILKQLSDAYRRIRNTSRFLLGNLNDFDPDKHTVAYEKMTPIDRYALHNLQGLIETARKAYDSYEFHIIYHALFNFCTLDLSAFYLDILKDRLYTCPMDDPARRSAQTALYQIADNLARLMAPIMVFTAEEIWGYLPSGKAKESIHLSSLPEVDEKLRDDALAEQWQAIKLVRSEVTKAMETARSEKVIGHSLDASVVVALDDKLFTLVAPYEDDLRSIFIVSEAKLQHGNLDDGVSSSDVQGIVVKVIPASGKKCERCWVYDLSVGLQPDHPTICNRCFNSLQIIKRPSSLC